MERRAARHARHGPPARPGFPLVLGVLMLATAGLVGWRFDVLGATFGRPEPATAAEGRSDAKVSRSRPVGTAPVTVTRAEDRRAATTGPATTVQDGTDAQESADGSRRDSGAALEDLIALGAPVMCGGGNEPLVALTFDDGPGPYTPETLDILNAAGVPATFFLAGKNLEAYPGFADLPRRMARRHVLGNHTWNHVSLPQASAEVRDREIGDTKAAIEAASGATVHLFRPPYGAHDDDVDALVASMGMLQVLWSVDSEDSAGATTPEVLSNVLTLSHPGAIILLHENRGTTLEALPDILAGLRARGLTPVTVPDLLAQDPPTEAQVLSGDCAS